MYKPESVLENEIHKILWNFEIRKYHRFSARRPDQELITKKKEFTILGDLAFLADCRVKIKIKQKTMNLDRDLKFKKMWNRRVIVIPIKCCPPPTLKESEIRGRIKTIQTAALLR